MNWFETLMGFREDSPAQVRSNITVDGNSLLSHINGKCLECGKLETPSLGELRGRASRMESIADLNTLKPIIQSLVGKGLMVELTPAGRGQVVTHALYSERELNQLRDQFAGGAPALESTSTSHSSIEFSTSISSPSSICRGAGGIKRNLRQKKSKRLKKIK